MACRCRGARWRIRLEEAERRGAKSCLARGREGVVVKAQIHAGGRGKGGGVKVARVAKRPKQQRRRSSGCSW